MTKHRKRRGISTANVISKKYIKKMIVYGSYYDVFQYGKEKVTWKQNVERAVCPQTFVKKDFSLARARQNIYRINIANIDNSIHNFKSVFVTFTFKHPYRYKTLKPAISKLNNFRKNVYYNYNIKVRYLIVPEFQKDGTIHFHGIIYNLPKLSILEWKNVWKWGSIDVQLVNNKKDKGGKSVENISAYISKYVSKDLNDKRLYGEKVFYTTRGLIRPIEIFETDYIDNILNSDSVTLLAKNMFYIFDRKYKNLQVIYYKLKNKN